MNEELEFNKVCEGSERQNKDLKWESPKNLIPNWISRWIPLRRIGEATLIEKKHSGLLLLSTSMKTQMGKKMRTEVVADQPCG